MDQCDAIGNGYSTRAHSSAVKPVLKYQSATIEMGHPARSEDRGLRAGWISEMLLETVGPPGPGVEVGSTCSANTSESLRARFESDSALATKAVTTQGTGTVCMCVCVCATAVSCRKERHCLGQAGSRSTRQRHYLSHEGSRNTRQRHCHSHKKLLKQAGRSRGKGSWSRRQ